MRLDGKTHGGAGKICPLNPAFVGIAAYSAFIGLEKAVRENAKKLKKI
jgi:hypothetical protein